MKKILLTMLVASSVLICKAQDKKFSFSLGGGLSSLSSSDGNGSAFGFGVDAQATLGLSDNIQGFAQTGYHSFSQDGASMGYIPFLVGAKYLAGSFRPGLGIGYGSFSGGGISVSGFSFSPQLGYNLDKLDIIANYSSTSILGGSMNVIGIKVLYQIF